MRRLASTIMVVGVIASMPSFVVAVPGPAGVVPWDGSGLALPTDRPVGTIQHNSRAPGLTSTADHIVSQQCGDGGFGWPHASCTTTYHNITGPICLGLLDAFAVTGAASHQASAMSGGLFDLLSAYPTGEPRFGTFTPYYMWRLTTDTGDPQFQTFAANEFFLALSNGTYGPTPYDTAGFISYVQTGRTGVWINLRPWEFHTLIHTAAAFGQSGQDALFLQAMLDGLNTLEGNPAVAYYDTLGLAGAVRGLALNGTASFAAISSPNHADINGMTTLDQLADQLVAYQNTDGSWNWHSALAAPTASDEDTQVTAYAVLALVAADPLTTASMQTPVLKGRAWLLSMQQTDGGIPSYPGGSENTEVEAEALMAMTAAGVGAAIPATSEWGLVVLTLLGLIAATLMFARRRAAA